jgi:hypothetical protein
MTDQELQFFMTDHELLHIGGGKLLTAKYAKGEKDFGWPCSRISRGSRFNSAFDL